MKSCDVVIISCLLLVLKLAHKKAAFGVVLVCLGYVCCDLEVNGAVLIER